MRKGEIMENAQLQVVECLTPFDELFPYFKNGMNKVEGWGTEQYFKVYNDGSHCVAKLITHTKSNNKKSEKSPFEKIFDKYFMLGLRNNLRKEKLHNFIKTSIIDDYGEIFEDLDLRITKLIERKFANIYNRLKLFKKKAHMNKWNYFVTITYDDKKHTAESFRTKLKKCLANFHCRRNWRYMGVFEYSPENHRLHFHALMSIPKGQMKGTIEEVRDYSTAQHKMQTTHINTFFAKLFGRNDFSEITECDVKFGNTIDYIVKYIAKSGERILYSRGIPSEIQVKLHYTCIAAMYFDFVEKFVLYDDVVQIVDDQILVKRRL